MEGEIGARRVLWIGLAAALLCAAAVTISLANPDSGGGAGWAAVGAATIAAPVAVGLYAWRRDPSSRFGALLVILGFAWFMTTLSRSDVGVLYSLGRVSAWGVTATLLYLFLAYPSGRLGRPSDRRLMLATASLVVALYLPTAFLVTQYPTPSPWSSCGGDCPANAFQLTSSQPGFVGDFVLPIRELITVAIFASIVYVVWTRLWRATPLMKRTLAPVLATAALCFAAAFAYVVARRAGASDNVLDVLSLLMVLAIPAASLGFLLGLLGWRLYEAEALERLALGLGDAEDPDQLRGLIAEAVGDPSLELYYAVPGRRRGWRDRHGDHVDLPPDTSKRDVTEVGDGSEPLAAIVCDPAFSDHARFIEAVGSCARASLETQRLATALQASLRDIEASRSRLAAAAATERQRMERDLHDSTQQQLVTLRVKLELVEERLKVDPAGGAAMLADIGPEIDEIIEGIRALARDIYPGVLASSGLADALRSAALRAALPVSVEANGTSRHPIEIESAVYFCCLEALQNAVKHAEGATGLRVSLSEVDGELSFEVSDDGCGFEVDGHGSGSGLTHLRDRLAAVGGKLEIESAPRVGTTVSGTVPLPS